MHADMQAFVLQAQTAYASGSVPIATASDGRRTLVVENDEFRLTDEFDGGNPFCGIGRLVQKSSGAAIWNGYYHGWLTPEAQGFSAATVFNFLRSALQQPTSLTFRGPATYEDQPGLRYVNVHEYGRFDGFYGREAIYSHRSDRPIYCGRYGGGLVNLSADTGEA